MKTNEAVMKVCRITLACVSFAVLAESAPNKLASYLGVKAPENISQDVQTVLESDEKTYFLGDTIFVHFGVRNKGAQSYRRENRSFRRSPRRFERLGKCFPGL